MKNQRRQVVRSLFQPFIKQVKSRFLLGLALFGLVFSSALYAAQVRFDAHYFFQTEEVLKEKKVDFEDMARYSRNLHSQIWKTMKTAKVAPSAGYLVVAVRSDQEVAVWLDMEPSLHEYYETAIAEAVSKVRPFRVESGIVVFAVKLSVDTAKHTSKLVPEPSAWQAARKKLADPDNIEELVLSIWPE